MMVNIYSKELEMIKGRIYEASAILKRPFDIKEKTARDIVTTNDILIERMLVDGIKSHFKGDEIISEESYQSFQQASRLWVIDPIDGTTNYSRAIPLYGIQVAFIAEGTVQFTVIFLVESIEMFVAINGQGAYCNGKRIRVGGRTDIKSSIISLGDFSTTNDNRNRRMLKLIEALMDKAYKIKIHGTACVDMTYVATGKTDVHIMSANHVWDYLPGLLLVSEAGGIVDTTLLESIGQKREMMVIASTKEIYNSMLELIG